MVQHRIGLTLCLFAAVGCADERRPGTASTTAAGAEVGQSAAPVVASGTTGLRDTAQGWTGREPVEVPLVGPGGSPVATEPSPGASEDPATPAEEPEVTPGVFEGFSPGATALDLQVLGDQRALTLESDGTVRLLDLAGERPQELAAFLLAPTGAPAGLGRMALGEGGLALVPAERGVGLFAPATARSSSDVTWVDFSHLSVTWPAGTRDSAGLEAGGQRLPLRGASAALTVAGRLLVTTTNPLPSGALGPGAVAAFPLGQAPADVEPQILATSGFAPSGLAALRAQAGPQVLVTNTGSAGGASVDVLDARTLERVASVRLPGADPWGPVVVSADGQRGYLASERRARVFVLDLTRLEEGDEAYLGSLELPASGRRAQVSQLLFDPRGRLLAVNHYESALYLLDLGPTAAKVQRVTGFARGGSVDAMEGLLERVAVQASGPEGVELLALTVELAPADRSVPGVTAALDRIVLPD